MKTDEQASEQEAARSRRLGDQCESEDWGKPAQLKLVNREDNI